MATRHDEMGARTRRAYNDGPMEETCSRLLEIYATVKRVLAVAITVAGLAGHV